LKLPAFLPERACTTKLRHDSFIAKVPKVLGEANAQNFLAVYVDGLAT